VEGYVPHVIVLNGCFGIGKSTIAAGLMNLIPGSCVIEPDNFAQFHPQNPPGGFDMHDYLWSMVFLVIGHALARGLTCVIPVALIEGVTSTSPSMFVSRTTNLHVPIYYYHLFASP
jgi:hypothetical protein